MLRTKKKPTSHSGCGKSYFWDIVECPFCRKVEPPNKGCFGARNFIYYRGVLYLEAINPIHLGIVNCRGVLYSECLLVPLYTNVILNDALLCRFDLPGFEPLDTGALTTFLSGNLQATDLIFISFIEPNTNPPLAQTNIPVIGSGGNSFTTIPDIYDFRLTSQCQNY